MLDILGVSEQENVAEAVNEPKDQLFSPTKIKVVGCGGCGGNAINNMVEAGIKGVQCIAMNTDLQHLSVSKADVKLQIGKKVTNGLGAGMHPERGEEAAKEDQETIKQLLEGSDMVFITAGMGGGTGTGSAPIVAKIARELGALTVAVVTTPFAFEGEPRALVANEGIKKLRAEVDSLIVIPNQRVFEGSDKKPSVMQGFKMIDDILRQGVQGISEIITKIGLVNRDFKDVETVMKGQGDAILGIGVAEGENRAVDAATAAINNKLLAETHIDGAKNILIKISGDESTGLDECEEIANLIKASADPKVKVLWGLYIEPELGKKISVTVVATGFNSPNSAIKEETPVEEVPVQKPDPNIFKIGDFEDVLNPSSQFNQRNGQNVSGQPAAVRSEPVGDDGLIKLMGKANSALNQSSQQNNTAASGANTDLFGQMKAAQVRTSGMNMPKGPIDPNDLSVPTGWRQLSNKIDLTRK